MKRRLLTILTLVGCVIGLGVTAAAASPTSVHRGKASTVTVVMHDPHCHWFLSAKTSHTRPSLARSGC